LSRKKKRKKVKRNMTLILKVLFICKKVDIQAL